MGYKIEGNTSLQQTEGTHPDALQAYYGPMSLDTVTVNGASSAYYVPDPQLLAQDAQAQADNLLRFQGLYTVYNNALYPRYTYAHEYPSQPAYKEPTPESDEQLIAKEEAIFG